MKRKVENKQALTYVELAKAKVSPARSVVISQCSAGGYTIAQQLIAQEGEGRSTAVFLKGALHVEGVEGLQELRDALNVAIRSVTT